MVRAVSAGKLSSFREGAQLSGVWTSSWLKMKAQNRIFPRSCVALARKVAGCLEPKMAPPQKLCGSCLSQKRLASVFHTLTRAACPPRSPGAKKAPAGACATNLSGQADPRALTRKVAGYLLFLFLKIFFIITYFPQLHFQCYPKSPPYPPPHFPTHPFPFFWPWRSPVLGHIKFACPMGLSFL